MKDKFFIPGLSSGLTVKVFLGFEYECPRGHRFMAAGPDKVLRQSPTARDQGGKLVGQDMPLYMGCLCK